MAVEVWRHAKGDRVDRGPNPNADIHWFAMGTLEQGEVTDELLAQSDALFDIYNSGVLFIARRGVAVEEVGNGHWDCHVYYGTVPITNEEIEAFEIGVATTRITQSIDTVASYSADAFDPPDFKGAINVSADGTVNGADIGDSGHVRTFTRYMADDDVDDTYRRTLEGLINTTNDATWKGHAAGEARFVGVSGAKRGQGDWELTFRFAISRNRTAVNVPETSPVFDPIDVEGWEYLWIYYADAEDGGAIKVIPRPLAAYVEKVFAEGDFDTLGLA